MEISSSPFTDERTLASVDFALVRERMAEWARSERGRAALAELVPDGDWARARTIAGAVTEMRELIAGGFDFAPMPDPADAVGRAAKNLVLRGEELYRIGAALAAADAAVRAVRDGETTFLLTLIATVRMQRDASRDLLEAVGPHGEILDTASGEIRRIRRGIAQALDAARSRAQQIASSSKYSRALQDSIVTQRDGRFVVPVKAEQQAAIPGIVHDASASGQTVFIEPLGVVEANNTVRALQREEAHEIERILGELSRAVGRDAANILHMLHAGAEIDQIYARAKYAAAVRGIEARYEPDVRLTVFDARHPLLGTAAVPQRFALGGDVRAIVISGPNMGGKTVSLKLAALCTLMAACGMHVPAGPDTAVGAFTSVVADIGDTQSIAANTSTFAGHLRRLRTMLDHAAPGMLFLVDEIASGTEAEAGSALAVAVLDALLERGAIGIVTTHAQELKSFAQSHDGVLNAGMRFAPETHEPTFELDIGLPGRSLALDLAAREGIDAQIIERARASLGNRETEYDRALAEISAARAEVTNEKRRLAAERAETGSVRARIEAERDALEREREKFLQTAEARLRETLHAFDAELRSRTQDDTRRIGRPQMETLGRTAAGLRREFRKNETAHSEKPVFAVGMPVYAANFPTAGTIVELHDGRAVVTIGAMRVTVAIDDLRPATARAATPRPVRRAQSGSLATDAGRRAEEQLERRERIGLEIDVRGRRYVDAQPLVDRWIDDALSAGISPIRLIHGKGTGMLGSGLQAMLAEHPHVAAYRYGTEQEGGGGVTIIDLS